MDSKILITGTGRSGTTFLIKLFTFLGFDTGWTLHNYKDAIFKNCNSGMERKFDSPHNVLKNPQFFVNIKQIASINHRNIEVILFPIRKFEHAVASRARHGKQAGGFTNNCKNRNEQLKFFNEHMSDYMYYTTKYDIPTIFIDFDRMITNKDYLYKKLALVMKSITPEDFHKAYKKACDSSKPKS